jgi:hypothetical protein
MSIEKSNDFIGIRTHDLPTCNIVPQPTTLPRAPQFIATALLFILQSSGVSLQGVSTFRTNRMQDGSIMFLRNVDTHSLQHTISLPKSPQHGSWAPSRYETEYSGSTTPEFCLLPVNWSYSEFLQLWDTPQYFTLNFSLTGIFPLSFLFLQKWLQVKAIRYAQTSCDGVRHLTL